VTKESQGMDLAWDLTAAASCDGDRLRARGHRADLL